MSVITVQNVSVAYGGRNVIEDVSFTLEEGDYLCIAGENGSGKTTLLKAITGLLKLKNGSIKFGDGLKNNEIGYLPQQTDMQKDFPASAREVVLSGFVGSMGLRPFYTKKQKNAADATMKRLGIFELQKKCYHELSGGQQQKILLARAICASGRLIVMDEPTTALDSGASEEFYSLISKLNKEGMTVVVISHDIPGIIGYANKVLHLGEQKPLFFGSAKDYTEKFLRKKEELK